MSRSYGSRLTSLLTPALVLAGAALLAAVFLLLGLPAATLQTPIETLAGLFGDGKIESLPDLLLSMKKAARLLLVLGGALLALGFFHHFLGRRLALAERDGGDEGLATPPGPFDRWWSVPPALLLLFLALPTLRQGLLWDEAWTVRTAIGSWLRVLAPDEANNHLLHTALLKLAASVFGASEPVYRLPALLAGLLLVVLIYRVSRALGHRETSALFAALAAAAGWGTVFCAVNARGYSLAAAAGAGLLLLRLTLPIPLTQRSLLVFCALTAVAALTLPTALIAVVAFFVSLVPLLGPFRDRLFAARQLIVALVLTGTLVALVYAWSLPARLLYMAGRLPHQDGFVDLALQRMFAPWGPAPDTIVGGLLVLVPTLLGLGLLARRLPVAAIYLGVLFALAMAVHWRGGYSQFWYSSMGLALLPLCFGELIDRAERGWRVPALLAGVAWVVVAAVATAQNLWPPRTTADIAVASLAAELKDGKAANVGVIEPTEALLYYLEKTKIPHRPIAEGSAELGELDYVLLRRACAQIELADCSCQDFGRATEMVSICRRGKISPASP